MEPSRKTWIRVPARAGESVATKKPMDAARTAHVKDDASAVFLDLFEIRIIGVAPHVLDMAVCESSKDKKFKLPC